MFRGYREYPYPSEELLYFILKENGRVTISADAHSIDSINYMFNDMEELLKDIGFKNIYEYKNLNYERVSL